ncbi:MAG: hypothetical protein GKS05_02970 [Nitrospirales bacterium]|nr:hypothetical protein [Nitrospirales bacterium]
MADDQGCGSGASVALAFLSGALLGAATAFLLAPQTGRESREGLVRVARRTGEDLRDLTDKASGSWDDMLAKGREFIDEASSAVKDAVDAGRDAMRRESRPDSGSETENPSRPQ